MPTSYRVAITPAALFLDRHPVAYIVDHAERVVTVSSTPDQTAGELLDLLTAATTRPQSFLTLARRSPPSLRR